MKQTIKDQWKWLKWRERRIDQWEQFIHHSSFVFIINWFAHFGTSWEYFHFTSLSSLSLSIDYNIMITFFPHQNHTNWRKLSFISNKFDLNIEIHWNKSLNKLYPNYPLRMLDGTFSFIFEFIDFSLKKRTKDITKQKKKKYNFFFDFVFILILIIFVFHFYFYKFLKFYTLNEICCSVFALKL